MTTWISHLRIAENLLAHLTGLDETSFTFGNIAPDSGLPNADWTEFDPPKELSHFLPVNAGEGSTQDLIFYRQYLQPLNQVQEPVIYSFMLGYFIHLLSDHLWSDKIGKTSREVYAHLFIDRPAFEAWNIMKEDWYGLDQRYVRDHPDCLFWRIFLNLPIPSSPLPFVRQPAFEHQVHYIRDYYSHPSNERVLDRPFPYLNEAAMSRYINETCAAVIKILHLLDACPPPEGLSSATLLLTSAETDGMTPPLGDC